jgi:hypothetical protein
MKRESMFRSALLFFVAAIVASNPVSAERANTPRAITKAERIFAIFTEDWDLISASDQRPRLIVGLWDDGYIVWSADQIHGGPPYFTGRARSDSLARLLAQLRREGVFNDRRLLRPRFAIDSKFTTILARIDGREVCMRSGHELERPREHSSTSDDLLPEDKHARIVWNEIRAKAAAVIPSQGTPVEGDFISAGGGLVWRPKPQ